MIEAPKINEIHRTECMTYPRSGHHLLIKLLIAHYGQRINYSEFYGDKWHLDTHPQTNLQKNHDFGFDAPVDKEDRQYLVQLRRPIDSIVSLYRLNYQGVGRQIFDPPLPEDNEETWRRFAQQQAVVWADFYVKWVLRPAVRPRLIVRYEDLARHPHATLTKVGKFLTGVSPTIEEVDNILQKIPVNPQANHTTFEYYTPEFHQRIHGMIERRILWHTGALDFTGS